MDGEILLFVQIEIERERRRNMLKVPPTALPVTASGTFNSLPRVLFMFRSLYLFAIGHMLE